MCGICGIFNLNGRPVAPQTLAAINRTLAHRGPDDEDCYIDGSLGLGHRRLAIIDLTPAGRQPMVSRDGRVVVTYNGEIFNFLELRAGLTAQGHHFHSRSDTEVLIHGYEAEGIDFIAKLNGMFALGLWDVRARTLYLVRDRYGIKPLYWTRHHDTVVFASEIKAILAHPDITAELNPEALNEYFTFQNQFRHHTLFKGINLLPAASICRISQADRGVQTKIWWDYSFARRDEEMTTQEAEEETLRLFTNAVSRQLISDVPVGSYLSGGLDSGSVVAVAAPHIPRLATFTCGFHMYTVKGVEAEYDERREAEVIANRFKTEHYQQVIGSGDLAWALPRVVYHLEDLRLGMSYSNYYISRLASRFVKVCLTGVGGDELYGGYPWRYYRVLRSVSQDAYLREYYNFWQRLVPDKDKHRLFTPAMWKQVKGQDTFKIFTQVFALNPALRYDTPEEQVANALYFEIKTFLASLFLVGDKLSMANSLEERFPFMDNDLVDFAMRIPIRHKLANLQEMKVIDENELMKWRHHRKSAEGKNVLRRAMSRLMPDEVTSMINSLSCCRQYLAAQARSPKMV
ncbi:MAG: asparagine synthase (glutamine-hydrolyzing) [Deltaproteobacteria bacterium]|nr:asparagine synthase (glutamine-hydrolyzing) [Deltaproteobacteria bacterium]